MDAYDFIQISPMNAFIYYTINWIQLGGKHGYLSCRH